ncbi:hypothetical protein HYU12_01180 [Candidatus Woesearchaeota archaeon]|nr:hypothetical protein [Candidatus Woesearchaeota archaeon]
METGRQKAYGFLRKHIAKIALAAAIVIIASLISGAPIKTIILAAALIAAASFSTFYFNYVSVPINFELVKLSTILMAYTHGMAAGLAVGITSTLLGKILIGRIDEKLPISAIAISAIAALAALFPTADIATLGITLTAIYNISLLALSLATGGQLSWNLPYEGTNFIINLILFTRIAPFIANIL